MFSKLMNPVSALGQLMPI